MQKENPTDTLLKSLYSFVKDEAENTRSEFKGIHSELKDIKGRLDHIESRMIGHENRITNLEDSSRIIKTKLGLA